jgi:hypothetical protein
LVKGEKKKKESSKRRKGLFSIIYDFSR